MLLAVPLIFASVAICTFAQQPQNQPPLSSVYDQRQIYPPQQYDPYRPHTQQPGYNFYDTRQQPPVYQKPNYDQYGPQNNDRDRWRYNQPRPPPGPPVYNPNFPNRGVFDQSTPAPGILGQWREDLQGAYRPGISREPPATVIVETNYGRVQGFVVELYDDPDVPPGERPGQPNNYERKRSTVLTYLGIPYAQAPIGEGRFRPPRPSRGWSLYQAVDYGPACPQPPRFIGAARGSRRMDEDCLYLNVFQPQSDGGGVSEPFPVLIHIHGGHFESGSSSTFPGHMLASWTRVVVVTFNYRLGALGFLSTGDEYSPGNYGLLDQAMAVKWVYDNIASFNGDPQKITVFGVGAGAAAAGMLKLAPKTNRYIWQVIAQSGSAVADWAITEDRYKVQNTSRVFAEKLGCLKDTNANMVDCLRFRRSFQEIGSLAFEPVLGTFPWTAVVDGDMRVPDDVTPGWNAKDWQLLPAHPRELLRRPNTRLTNFRYLNGLDRDEAAYLVYYNETLRPSFDVSKQLFDQKVREYILRYNYTLNPEAIFNAIDYIYTYWPDPLNLTHIREEYIRFWSDNLYTAPNDEMVKLLLAKEVPVYSYVLNTTVEGKRIPAWQQWRQVSHNTEYYFITGAPFMDPEFYPEDDVRVNRHLWTEGDRNMSQFFMEAFSNFSKYGEPTRQAILSVYWEPARGADLRYLNLNHTYNSSMMVNYRQWESAFWIQYLPTLVGRLLPTYPPITEYWWEPREPLQIAFWSLAGTCLLLVVVCISCCLLWRSARSKSQHLKYDSAAFMLSGMRENQYAASDTMSNHHKAAEASQQPSLLGAPSEDDYEEEKLVNTNHNVPASVASSMTTTSVGPRSPKRVKSREKPAPSQTTV